MGSLGRLIGGIGDPDVVNVGLSGGVPGRIVPSQVPGQLQQSSASSRLLTGLLHYLNDCQTDVAGGDNLSGVNGVTYPSSGPGGNVAAVLGASEEKSLHFATGLALPNGQAWSEQIWFNLASTPTSQMALSGCLDDNLGTLTINSLSLGFIQNDLVHFVEIDYPTPLVTGVWNHLVVTHDGVSVTLVYLNGVLIQTITDALLVGPFTIRDLGANKAGSGQWFDGSLALPGAWGIVLSQVKITELYNAGSGLLWPFTGSV